MAFGITGYPSLQSYNVNMDAGMASTMLAGPMPMCGMGGGCEQFQASPMMLMLGMFQASMMMNFVMSMGQYQQAGQRPGFSGFPGMAFPNTGGYAPGGGVPMNPCCGPQETPAWPSMAGNQAGRAVQVAQTQVGVCGGNPQIRQYSQGRSEAWCADFVSWCYERSGGGAASAPPSWRRWVLAT